MPPTITYDNALPARDYEKIVHLPLEKLDKCSCGKTSNIRLCSKCGEGLYCGPDCQTKDWPQHKRVCGKTDRISLLSFYPHLALIADINRIHPDRPIHPALTHEILNSPNPPPRSTGFPDGSAAQLILLGDPIPLTDLSSPRWWPTAQSQAIRTKLSNRFLREGTSLSILTAVCLSLLSEMYSTTYVPKEASPDGKPQPRLRLTYNSSPIADFGIATGSADVKVQDRLAYFSARDQRFWKGENPDEHYWIYFRTVRGEEFTLDLGMYTFNMCLLVPPAPYWNPHMPPLQGLRPAPAFFYERNLKHSVVSLYKERSRASVLRDSSLHEAIRLSASQFEPKAVKTIHDFMARLAGKPIPMDELDLTIKWTMNDMDLMQSALLDRAWTRWPKEPGCCIDADPGELDNKPGYTDEDFAAFAKKWHKKYRKGKITREALDKAHQTYKGHADTP
ncbi:hypothetical protein BD626DRAFT_504758 [Schizophyllum amplum]|uniref:MYND-type domain-containing protein n=1 Tax=Schizophyllum amplum TaxID=97359 RepID=A0A550C785_9AGAR|nr:hypothetical protein BD626DRAFT_504758 [Auriculariopsis ampla]